MAYIGPIPAETFTSFATQTFSTSATSSYTLDHPVTNENELALFINNVRQQPGSGKAYTATGTALTLSANTASTDTMYAVFLGRALQTVNPAGGSVGSSQITAEMITGQTALSSAPADTDEFLISDAGVLKRIDYSLVKSGGLVHLQTTNITSGTANVQFTSNIDSNHNAYLFVLSDVHPATDAQALQMTFSTDGGSSYISTNYGLAHKGNTAGGSEVSHYLSNASRFDMSSQNVGNAADESISVQVYLHKPSGTDGHKLINGTSTVVDNNNTVSASVFGGMNYSTTAAITAVKFAFGSGNIDRGDFTMFGVANS